MEYKIHHIGYLVKKIRKAIEVMKVLGYNQISEIIYDDYRMIDICFLEKEGYVIEVLSPKGNESIVTGLLKKFGNSPYHICYLCDDIEGALVKLKIAGFVQWDEPHSAIALDNCKVCFLVHPFMGMIEILEEKNNR